MTEADSDTFWKCAWQALLMDCLWGQEAERHEVGLRAFNPSPGLLGSAGPEQEQGSNQVLAGRFLAARSQDWRTSLEGQSTHWGA